MHSRRQSKTAHCGLEPLLNGAFPRILTYFCEDGPAELSLNCSGEPPRETLILTELSNSARPWPNAHRCRMIDFLSTGSLLRRIKQKYVTYTRDKT